MQTEQSCKDKEGPDEKLIKEIENQEITDDELLGRIRRMIKTVKSQMGIQNGSINTGNSRQGNPDPDEQKQRQEQ